MSSRNYMMHCNVLYHISPSHAIMIYLSGALKNFIRIQVCVAMLGFISAVISTIFTFYSNTDSQNFIKVYIKNSLNNFSQRYTAANKSSNWLNKWKTNSFFFPPTFMNKFLTRHSAARLMLSIKSLRYVTSIYS